MPTSPKRSCTVDGTVTAASPQPRRGAASRASRGSPTARCRRRAARRRGRATTIRGGRRSRRGMSRSARTRRCPRSTRGARRVGGSRSGCRRSCRACPTRRSRAVGSMRSSEHSNQPVARMSVCSDQRRDVGGIEIARPPGDLGVPEAVEREPWLPPLGAAAAQRVAVRRLGALAAVRCRARRPGAPRRGGS